jgi:methionyl-tRNA synthetase
MRDIAFGQDGDFSHQNLLARYHGELGNGLGNLLHRMVASIVPKHFGGLVPAVDPRAVGERERELVEIAQRAAVAAGQHLDAIAPHKALDAIWELVAATNKYVDQTEPWQLAKRGDRERLAEVVYAVLESLRWLSVMLWPFMPRKCSAMRDQLGLPPLLPTIGEDRWPNAWGGLVPGTRTRPGAPLFPRFDDDRQRAFYERLGAPLPETLRREPPAVPAPPPTPVSARKDRKADDTARPPQDSITLDDFARIDLRLGLVRSAARVPKSEKLLELRVDVGEPEPRTILAGIGQHYTPEQLVGRRLAVVLNLPPRTMMGRTSYGMVLAVSDDSGLSVLSPDKEIAPGVKVK